MIREFIRALKILLVTAAVLLGGLLVTGNFRIDTAHKTTFGVYDSSLAGLPAYYNPALNTLAFLEYIPLFLLPIMLLIGRLVIQSLRQVSMIPWLVLMPIILFATFVWPHSLALGSGTIDPTVSSEFTYFLEAQIPLAIGLGLSYGLLGLRRKLREI